MLIPRRVKHRKQHHPKRNGMAKGGTELAFGEYGIQAVTPAYVTNRQIEAEWWIANVKPGRVMFELSYPNEKIAREALTRAAHKLPMKCRIVRREAGES
ncbi:hypothetical protein ACZ90_06255 [Streptomyces albus subsp. albus]|nr:hypothetical protein ACZ90_06255 [Streptomyces albus subsp. albus]